MRVDKIAPAPFHERAVPAAAEQSVPPFENEGRGGISHAAERHETPAFTFIRRARGYTPAPIKLARSGPPILATGGFLKNTACATRGAEAFLSQHIGDLDNAASCVALEEAVDHLQRVLEIRPAAIAHDLHPDFFSTQLAVRLAAVLGVPAVGVQHHHAHIAAVAAEHGATGPLLGVALDGVGHGSDGDAWGGELLRVDAHGFERLGHLRPLPLPRGDRAAREPWRMAAVVLHLTGRGDEIARRFAQQPAAAAVADMLARGVRCPPTTSAGRWFDAVAGLLGVRDTMNYEGQAAMLLEALAARHGAVAPDASLYALDADNTLDLLPLAQRLADERDAAFGAALFHATFAAALAAWVARGARDGHHDRRVRRRVFPERDPCEPARAAARRSRLPRTTRAVRTAERRRHRARPGMGRAAKHRRSLKCVLRFRYGSSSSRTTTMRSSTWAESERGSRLHWSTVSRSATT
ncbi:MAG: hypothetical protein OHK0044_27740 [Burkholderiaceae bacterium]